MRKRHRMTTAFGRSRVRGVLVPAAPGAPWRHSELREVFDLYLGAVETVLRNPGASSRALAGRAGPRQRPGGPTAQRLD